MRDLNKYRHIRLKVRAYYNKKHRKKFIRIGFKTYKLSVHKLNCSQAL